MAEDDTTEGDAMSVGENIAVWSCQIGWAHRDHLPSGSDGPMRSAVERAFKELTGYDEEFTFSGWGDTLSEVRLAVVENREPTPINTDRLNGNTDAQAWAEEFCGHFGGDVGLMIGWFANAIETGRDAGRPSGPRAQCINGPQ